MPGGIQVRSVSSHALAPSVVMIWLDFHFPFQYSAPPTSASLIPLPAGHGDDARFGGVFLTARHMDSINSKLAEDGQHAQHL